MPQNLPHFHVKLVQSHQPRLISKKKLYHFRCKSHSSVFPGYYSMSTFLKWACYPVVLLVGNRWQYTVDNSLKIFPYRVPDGVTKSRLIEGKMPASPWADSVIYLWVTVWNCVTWLNYYLYIKKLMKKFICLFWPSSFYIRFFFCNL